MVIQANQQFNTNFIGFNEGIWPMNELTVRKAMVMSFDQKTDIEKVAMGYADPLTGFLPKGFEEYNADMKGFDFNPTEAKKLFDSMDFKGYKEAGLMGDINRFLHSIGLANNQTTITLFYNAGNDGRKTACLLLTDQVEKYDSGVKVDVQELDWPTYMAKSKAKALPVIYLGWLADYPAPDNFAFAIATTTGDCARRIAYKNPANDKLFEQAIAEPDLAKRKAIYDQMVTNVNNDAAYIYRGQAKLLIVLRKDVKGYQFAPLDNWVLYYTLDK
jgi:ABC-type transport system substrate-binding protein